MKIIIVINNLPYKYMEYSSTGTLNQVDRRTVEIELTDEQISKIALDVKNETIESISKQIS